MKGSLLFSLCLSVSVVAGCAVASDEIEIASDREALMSEVPDLDGLPGYFIRVPTIAPTGELKSVWLTGQANEGEYTRTVSKFCLVPGCNVETGYYWAVPNNPMMGWAFIGFFDEAGEARDYYIIDGILRGPLGDIVTMQMRKVYDEHIGFPLIVQRLW